MLYVTQQFSLELLRNLNESGFRVRQTREDSFQQSLLRLISGRLFRIPYLWFLLWDFLPAFYQEGIALLFLFPGRRRQSLLHTFALGPSEPHALTLLEQNLEGGP